MILDFEYAFCMVKYKKIGIVCCPIGILMKAIGHLILGGATLLGADVHADDNPPQTSVIERVRAASPKELVEFLDADSFIVREQAYRLLMAQMNAATEDAGTAIDKTLFTPDKKIHSPEQYLRLRSILEQVTYTEMQLRWRGAEYQPSPEEIARIHSVGDLLRSLSDATGNPIAMQYFDQIFANMPIEHPEQFVGKKFWEAIGMIRGDSEECIRINTSHGGMTYIGEHYGALRMASTDAIYARMERYETSTQIQFFLQPNLCPLKKSVFKAQGTMKDGSIIDLSHWQQWTGGSIDDNVSVSLPAATVDGETIDIDIECEFWALPMQKFVLDDLEKPVSFATNTLHICAEGMLEWRNHNEWDIPLTIARRTYPPFTQDSTLQQRFEGAIEMMFMDKEGNVINRSAFITYPRDPVKKIWHIENQKPAHATLYVPELILLHTKKTLHFADVPLPEKTQ